MNLSLSAFNFNNDFLLNVIETNREPVEDYGDVYDRVSYPLPKSSYSAGKKLGIVLVDLITGQMYAQSALEGSQISLIIENLENALNTNKRISLFNENGLISPLSTIQSLGLREGDAIAFIYHSIKGTDHLQLQDLFLPSLCNKSRFIDAIRNRPCMQLDSLRFSYKPQSPEHVPALILSFTDHAISTITVSDSLENFEFCIDGLSAVRNNAITSVRQLFIPCTPC